MLAMFGARDRWQSVKQPITSSPIDGNCTSPTNSLLLSNRFLCQASKKSDLFKETVRLGNQQ